MIKNVKVNFRISETSIPELEKVVIMSRVQNKFRMLADEINQQNGTIIIDIYSNGNYRYDIEGVDIKLRHKFLNDFIHE
jgi:hypothetical protein